MRFSGHNGVAAVEAAVCLPVLAIIIFGAIEVSGGIFQEYNVQASAYELSKVALRKDSTCSDVQAMAEQLLPNQDIENYTINIDVEPRTVNLDSVEPPAVTSFVITSSSATDGLEELPRGTLLRLSLEADRPRVSGRGFFRVFLGERINADSVFVKEF